MDEREGALSSVIVKRQTVDLKQMEDQVEHLTDINDFLKKDWENSLQEVVELKIKVDQREKEIEKLHKHYDNKLEKQKRTYENKIKGLEH